MLTFGVGIGALLFAVGIITYVFAPRVGPNPIFGVRVGYAYANREVWDKTNRFGGMLFALIGLGVALAACLLQLLAVSTGVGMSVLTVGMLVTIFGATAWMMLYARNLAQGTTIARELLRVEFNWAFLAPALVTFALLVLMAIYSYQVLPANRVATHFNFYDQPDGWTSRDSFLINFLGMAALFTLFDAVVVLIAAREPLIAFGRWGTGWRLEPERGLIYTGIAFGLVNLILLAALWDIVWFNTRGVHAFPLSLFLWIAIPLILFFVVLFFALARRTSPPAPR